jgi:hypothetical protein
MPTRTAIFAVSGPKQLQAPARKRSETKTHSTSFWTQQSLHIEQCMTQFKSSFSETQIRGSVSAGCMLTHSFIIFHNFIIQTRNFKTNPKN